MLPRPVPEWRMYEVDPVVEHLAPFRRRTRHARELPVDRVEHHEHKARQDAPPIFALPEEIESKDAEDRSDERDEIWSEPRASGPPRQVEGRLAPEVEGEDVRYPFIRRVV